MELSAEQEFVIQEVLKFKNPIAKVGGFAGTGKTFLIKHLVEKYLPQFAVCAFTGKAAQMLRKKGISEASTIHSLIYTPLLDGAGHIVLDKNGSPIFILSPTLGHEGIIIDEASMVSKEIYEDLCSFGIPLIFVGDHGQLEPVGEGTNLMQHPDYILETIHRNAGEIAYFAEFIRKGFRPAAFPTSGKIKFVGRYNVDKHLDLPDQIICAYNKTRVGINEKVRQNKGFVPNSPMVGDRVMCLRNDKKKFLFNGMQGEIVHLYKKPKNKMSFLSEGVQHEVLFDQGQFNREKYDFDGDRDAPAPFDYAYCITAHKSQGDEWNKVMVLEQKCQHWDHRRWAYTAASRAKEMVIWVEM
jgi:exodeoxyribonuclease-5